MRRFLLLLLVVVTALCAGADEAGAQNAVLLTGRVADQSGTPLAAASVTLVGTTVGVTTDATGRYAMRIPAGTQRNATIRVEFIGMATVNVVWGGRTQIDAVLKPQDFEAEKVVVTGIVNINQRDVAGSFTTLKAEDIMLPAVNNLDEMLQGQVAGMAVLSSSMRAGAAPEITIRGRSTLLGTTEPLWVVDGIIQPAVQKTTSWNNAGDDDLDEYIGSAISWLNPNDVETITILKDASATAIYGSRASNGVIVVTTKKGSSNRQSLRASYNLSVGQQLNYDLYKLMNSQERINFSKYAYNAGVYYQNTPIAQMYTYEGMYNMFLAGKLSEQDFVRQYNYLETVNTDWLDLLTRPSLNQNFSLNASGGTDKITYVASASYADQKAAERGNGSKRYTGRLAVDMAPAPRLRVNVSLAGSMSTTTGFANSGIDPIGYATTVSRAIPAYNADGSLAYYQRRESYKYNADTSASGLPYNVLDDMANVGSRVENPTLQASFDLKWRMLDDLTYQMVAGYTNNSRNGESWMGEGSFHVMQKYRGYRVDSDEALDNAYRDAAILKHGGILITDQMNSRSYNVRNQLNYNRSLFASHRLTAMAMWEISSAARNSKYNTVYGYDRLRGEKANEPAVPSELVPIGGATPPSTYVDTYGNYSKAGWRSSNVTQNTASLAMIGAYTINNKYVLNVNFRNDWSNAFGQNANRRFNPAWSAGVSWRLGDEGFMEGLSGVISAANMRLTYGTQGNVTNSQTTEMVLSHGALHPIYDEYVPNISRLANPYMSWERTRSWNAGLDLGLFDNRVTMVVDAYTRLSNVGRTFADTYENGGFSSTLPGTYIRNTGIEGSLSFTPIDTDLWRLSVSANASKNWSKITREEQSDATSYNIDTYVTGQTERVIVAGYPLGAFWAYRYAGPHVEYGIPTFHYFHEGAYTEAETRQSRTDILVYAGSRISDISGGVSLRLSYRNLTLSGQLAASIGGKGFLLNPYGSFSGGRMPEPTANLNNELLKMWTKDKPGSAFPGLYIVPDELALPITLADPTSPSGAYYDRYDMWGKSDARVASLSTLRCRSLSLAWKMNTARSEGTVAARLKQAGVDNVDITAAVNNVFLLADKKWQGMDPDLGGDRKMPRSFTLGINFGF